MNKAQSVISELMQAAQAAGGGAETNAGAEHQHGENCDGSCGDDCKNKGDDKKDGPVDADFEVVDDKK